MIGLLKKGRSFTLIAVWSIQGQSIASSSACNIRRVKCLPMNLTLTFEIAILLLNLIVIGIWKPWLGAYGGEKGKNLARKEDLDKLLTETKILIAGQEEIKARFAGDLWNKQMVLTQKKDGYVRIVSLIDRLISDFLTWNNAPYFIPLLKDSPDEQERWRVNAAEAKTRLYTSYESLRLEYSLAAIFAGDKVYAALKLYFESGPFALTREHMDKLAALMNTMREVAKGDLLQT